MSNIPPIDVVKAGAINVPNRERRSRAHTGEVEGLKLGRFPFPAAVSYHMGKRYGIIAETTYAEEERKLRYLGGVFKGLKEKGLVNSDDPRQLTARDIQEFMAWMKKQQLDPYTQAKYLQHLKNLLKTMKNHVLDDMKADGVRFPKNPRKPIRTISVEGLETIFDTLDSMDGWAGSMSRGVCALAFATGTRPKEWRLADAEDLDLKKQRFFVRHPKGEGSWASTEWVDIIRPDMIPILERFDRERKQYLASKGFRKAKALFPNFTKGQDGYYSANHFNKLKTEIEKQSGVDFRLKDFRSTLTTITCNRDRSLLPAMSAQLRHTDLKTTQRYYDDAERGVAGKQLKDSFKESDSIKTQRPVIESQKYMSGYA